VSLELIYSIAALIVVLILWVALRDRKPPKEWELQHSAVPARTEL